MGFLYASVNGRSKDRYLGKDGFEERHLAELLVALTVTAEAAEELAAGS